MFKLVRQEEAIQQIMCNNHFKQDVLKHHRKLFPPDYQTHCFSYNNQYIFQILLVA